MAKDLLSRNGWKVSYSDYDDHCIAETHDSLMSESMSADDVKKFIKLARNGEVNFKFKEVKDGSVRLARGTLKKDVI